MFLATGFAQGITAGFSILTAQRYWAGAWKKVWKRKRWTKRNDPGGDRSGHPDTCLCVDHEPAAALMNTPSDIFQDAYTYIMGISIGLTANIFYNLFSAYLRAVGKQPGPAVFPDIFRLSERGT